jgi:hypothetical protein
LKPANTSFSLAFIPFSSSRGSRAWLGFPTGVGKTCLLLRFVDDKFSPSFITTIGIDFKVKQVTIRDKKVKLQVYPVDVCVR